MTKWSSHLQLAGINFQTAPLSVRERFASRQLQDLVGARSAGRLGKEGPAAAELAILSTCNRTEVYAVLRGEVPSSMAEAWTSWLGLQPREKACFYFLSGIDVSRHLFKVAAGAGSQIIGEPQILNQIKEAYRRSVEAKTCGPILHALFRHALHAGKRARTETEIAKGPASVGHAAALLARKIFGELSRTHLLLVGAGEMGELTARALSGQGVRHLFVTSRDPASSQRLAQKLGGQAIPFAQAEDQLVTVDIAVTSTSAPKAIFGVDQLRRVMRRRRGKPLFIVDIAVPRDVEAAAGALEGLYLYNIDDLQSVVLQGQAERRAEVSRADLIIEQEVGFFTSWLEGLRAKPAILELQAMAQGVLEEEIARYRSRLDRLPQEDRALVEEMTRRLVNRLLDRPMRNLKAIAEDGYDERTLTALIRRLYELPAPPLSGEVKGTDAERKA